MRREFGQRDGDGWRVHRETVTEARLGRALRRLGLHVEQEVPIGPYTADFLVEGRLVVEVDGSSHAVRGRADSDRRRDRQLAAWGFQVLRVPAREVALGKAGHWADRAAAALRPQAGQPLASEAWKQQLGALKTDLESAARRRRTRKRGEERAAGPSQAGPTAPPGPEPTMAELLAEPTPESFAALLDQGPAPPDKDADAGAAPRRRRRR